jgi:hypothetical protein
MLWHVKDGRRTDIPEDRFHAEIMRRADLFVLDLMSWSITVIH